MRCQREREREKDFGRGRRGGRKKKEKKRSGSREIRKRKTNQFGPSFSSNLRLSLHSECIRRTLPLSQTQGACFQVEAKAGQRLNTRREHTAFQWERTRHQRSSDRRFLIHHPRARRSGYLFLLSASQRADTKTQDTHQGTRGSASRRARRRRREEPRRQGHQQHCAWRTAPGARRGARSAWTAWWRPSLCRGGL